MPLLSLRFRSIVPNTFHHLLFVFIIGGDIRIRIGNWQYYGAFHISIHSRHSLQSINMKCSAYCKNCTPTDKESLDPIHSINAMGWNVSENMDFVLVRALRTLCTNEYCKWSHYFKYALVLPCIESLWMAVSFQKLSAKQMSAFGIQ